MSDKPDMRTVYEMNPRERQIIGKAAIAKEEAIAEADTARKRAVSLEGHLLALLEMMTGERPDSYHVDLDAGVITAPSLKGNEGAESNTEGEGGSG